MHHSRHGRQVLIASGRDDKDSYSDGYYYSRDGSPLRRCKYGTGRVIHKPTGYAYRSSGGIVYCRCHSGIFSRWLDYLYRYEYESELVCH